jgi:hypothetical protein
VNIFQKPVHNHNRYNLKNLLWGAIIVKKIVIKASSEKPSKNSSKKGTGKYLVGVGKNF